MDEDESGEQLKVEQRCHPGGNLVLDIDTDEDSGARFGRNRT